VQRLATGWTTEGPEIESPQGQEFSLIHFVHTGPGARPASYPMGIGGNAAGGVKLNTRLQLVPKSTERIFVLPLPPPQVFMA
jgi:hypothetical protein